MSQTINISDGDITNCNGMVIVINGLQYIHSVTKRPTCLKGAFFLY